MNSEHRSTLRPVFVESVPNTHLVESDVLYVSMAYATAIHKCACGCGSETVTPLAPDEWSLIYDGETISLTPSIGNQRLECGSHYWIRQNKVDWVVDDERGWLAAFKKTMRSAIQQVFRDRRIGR